MAKGCALIRSYFGIDAEKLEFEDWARLLGQASWLERDRQEKLARMLAALFGGKKDESG